MKREYSLCESVTIGGSRVDLLLMILLMLELQFSEIETRKIVKRSSIFEQGE